MLLDDRIQVGANLDGRLSTPVLSQGLDKPFLLFGRAGHQSEDPTWAPFWDTLRGPKVELALAGAVHLSFIDYPFLIEALHLPNQYQPLLEPVIGTIAGTRIQNLLADTLNGVFRFVLDHSSKIFMNALDSYPEVSEVNSTLS